MEKLVLVLVVLLAMAARRSEATLDLSSWKPVCHSATSVDLLSNAVFTNYKVTVSEPQGDCTPKSFTDLHSANHLLSSGCFSPSKHVELKIQHVNGNKFAGGKNYLDVQISCIPNGEGNQQTFTANVNPGEAPTKIPVEFGDISLQLVTEDAVTGRLATGLSLGQENVFLRVKHTGTDQYVLLPITCKGIGEKPSDAAAPFYKFFSASENECKYEGDIMEKFTVSPSSTSVKFYPFKFTSGDKVTLSCEVLVCPSGTTAKPTGNHCDKVMNKIEQGCAAGDVQQARRRRRSAGGPEPHTRVLEVTYSVASSDPALQGHAAAGAHVAVSLPLLAAVASLWTL